MVNKYIMPFLGDKIILEFVVLHNIVFTTFVFN